MIRPGTVLAVAASEARLCRRLVRYWIFTGLAALVGLGSYAYYAWLHWAFSSWSATVASINPRFLVGAIGIYYVLLFAFGLVFLGFDVRARDTRERIADVLDARPLTNLELMLGKMLGILIPSWIPVVIVALAILLLGQLAGEPIEPLSLVSLTVAMVIPAFVFTLGLVFAITLLVRHRGLAAVVLIATLVGLYVLLFRTPIYLIALVDFTGAYVARFPSDLVPGIVDLWGLSQRLGVLAVGLGLTVFAAAIHPRLDQTPRRQVALLAAGCCALGALLCGWPAWVGAREVGWREEARTAHQALASEPAPDLLSIHGLVRLRPGRGLDEELKLHFRAPAGDGLEVARFTLNPGLTVVTLTAESGAAVPFERHHGLVEARLPSRLAPGAETTLALTASGMPEDWFGYMDAVIDPMRVRPYNGQIFLLGFQTLVLERGFAGLLPGARWLPASGADMGRDDPRTRPRDFFDVDLEVEVPEGWLAAGPGRRQEGRTQAGSGRRMFRFAPPAPVPGVALVAGRYESRQLEVDGVTLEALVHPKHVRSLEYFEDASDEVARWLSERMAEAEKVGLRYPYDALTLAEVPGVLRGFAGGWRLDSTLAQPALILAREAGFPTARFDTAFRQPEKFRDREGGLPRAKRERLERFFENDFSGGNPFVAGARSFFGSVTGGSGVEGLPLDFVFENLASRVVVDKQGYFSAHLFNNKDIDKMVGETLQAFFTGQSGTNVADVVLQQVAAKNDVWDAILSVSLARLDPWEAPKRTVDVLTVKAGAMARSMIDGLGREKAGRLLGALREQRSGQAFSRDDVLRAGTAVGEDLDSWLDVWLERTELPGFVMGPTTLSRLVDGPGGTPRYQLLVTVVNAEATPGLLRLDTSSSAPVPRFGQSAGGSGEGDEAKPEEAHSDPLRIEGHSAVEIGTVMAKPPRHARIVPYLALNRRPFDVPLPEVDEEKLIAAEPFVGARPVAWSAPTDVAVVVDDLDPGFRVEESEKRGWFRFGRRGGDEETDQGLPLRQVGRLPERWSRDSSPVAWGKYRHTMVLVKAGTGERRAIFSADIARSGPWQLELHLPRRARSAGDGRFNGGKWTLVVVDGAERQELPFDADAGETGWNSLGTHELSAGTIAVELSDKTDGRFVIADAIRWTPATVAARAAAAPGGAVGTP